MEEHSVWFSSVLFQDIQKNGLYDDSKTVTDATFKPGLSLDNVLKAYKEQRNNFDFVLKDFVDSCFILPKDTDLESKVLGIKVSDYIMNLWSLLTRQDFTTEENLTKICLPKEYVVPGGRFRELYYWDSYFTIKGLIISKRIDEVMSMIDNFTWLIERYGFIPNGTRTYYLSRSQPPLYVLMLKDMFKELNLPISERYVNALIQEYKFWMSGEDLLNTTKLSCKRVVKVNDHILNRYWDDLNEPRPESYKEDVQLANNNPAESRPDFYRNIRAACESGWDFSSRWCKVPNSLETIHTTDIIPIDLNCHLYLVEKYLSEWLNQLNRKEEADDYQIRSIKRYKAIHDLLYCSDDCCFYDRTISTNKLNKVLHSACFQPLFAELVTTEQAQKLSQIIEEKFLFSGGIVTSLVQSEQQWDYPNGWAPLQYFVYCGLKSYHFTALANKIATNFLNFIEKDFEKTKTLKEKYDVININNQASGGEYKLQVGFGWTNGVILYFLRELNQI